MNNIKELQSLLKARYDLLYIVTHEEERVASDLSQIASVTNMSICSWTFTSGVKMLKGIINAVVETTSGGKKTSQNAKIEDGAFAGQPTRILTVLRDCKEDCIFMLYDYHSYFKDAEVVRELKDALAKFKPSYTPLVIISPVLKIPIEIEKATTVVDYTLPSREEIAELISGIVVQLSDNTNPIQVSDAVKADVVRACQGLTVKEIENVTMRSLVENETLDPKAVMYQKKQTIKKSGMLEYYESTEAMTDVGGMDLLKDWLRKRKGAFTDEARAFGLPTPKGVMMLGIPGCGKTLICKAIAQSWGMPLLRFDVGAVMQGVVGSSEENMRKVIQVAEASSPCILWLDEIEKGLSGTGSSNFSDAGTTARVFATFLTWLNEKKSEVFVVATANNVEQLPPELLRKGRFDETFFVDLPSLTDRKEIFSILLVKRKRDPRKFNLDILAKNSDGFSGADIEASIESALFDVYTDDMGSTDIADLNIIKALKETVPLSKMMGPQIKKVKDWCTNNRARLASSTTGGT